MADRSARSSSQRRRPARPCGRQADATAWVQGGDFWLRHFFGKFGFDFGYTALDSRDDGGNYVTYTPKNVFKARLSWRMDDYGMTAYISAESAADRHYSDRDGSELKIDDYNIMNLSIAKRICGNFNVSFSVENVFDLKYQYYEEE